MARSKGLDVKTLDAARPRAKAYRLGEPGGLLLEVKPTGAKVWMCRLTIAGKRRDMGLGGYPAVSLKEARFAARTARDRAAAGGDPIRERVQEKEQAKADAIAEAEADTRTFKAVSDLCITSLEPGWKQARTAKDWRNALKAHVHPVIGKKPVAQVDRAEVAKAVDGVWSSNPALARKLVGYIGTILRFAAAKSWRLNDNPADPRMLRHMGLPVLPGGEKHPSLPWPKTPAFMAALGKRDDMASVALAFAILTATRSGATRGAYGRELSFDGTPIWTVPAERMKRKKNAIALPHRVPLSPAALTILARAYSLATGSAVSVDDLPTIAARRRDLLIFPSAKKDVQLAVSTLSVLIHDMNAIRPEGEPASWRDLDGREAVPHGFRATFRTWVDDTRPQDVVAAERALAHDDPDKTVSAYRRSDLLERRIPLMVDWGAFCLGTGQRAKGGRRRPVIRKPGAE